MSKVRVITDTIGCLPLDLVEQYGISILPMGLAINGKSYKDQVDITPDDFWKMFKDIKEFSTSAVSVGDFADKYRELAKTTDSIICIHVSANLTAVCESAKQAMEIVKKELPNLKIELVDSKSATGAEGYIALEAARAAEAGKSLAEVVKVAQEMVPKVKFYCAMDTLKYLIRSGRAPKTAYMGELFQVKPMVGMTNGSGIVENLGHVRTKKKCLQKMAEMVKDYADVSQPMHFMFHYSDNIKDGEELRDEVLSRYKSVETYMTPYSPVMGGHVGPVVAVAFYNT